MLREFFSSRYEWGRKKKQTVHRKRGGPLLFFLAEDRKRKSKRAGCILCYLSLHQHEVRRFFSLGPMRGKKGAKLSVFRNQVSVESYETRIQGCVHKKKKTNLEIIDVGVSLCSNQYAISFMKRITPIRDFCSKRHARIATNRYIATIYRATPFRRSGCNNF